jgi:hypothetical protein
MRIIAKVAHPDSRPLIISRHIWAELWRRLRAHAECDDNSLGRISAEEFRERFVSAACKAIQRRWQCARERSLIVISMAMRANILCNGVASRSVMLADVWCAACIYIMFTPLAGQTSGDCFFARHHHHQVPPTGTICLSILDACKLKERADLI